MWRRWQQQPGEPGWRSTSPGPHSPPLGWRWQPNKRRNMAGSALPSSSPGGKLVRFDHVVRAHRSGLACCSLCDKPSEFSDLSRQLLGFEERQERVMEMRREQQCKFCWQTVAAAVLSAFEFSVCRPSPLVGEEKVTFVLHAVLCGTLLGLWCVFCLSGN